MMKASHQNVKKIAAVLLTASCLFLTGCSIAFAREEYDNTGVIASGDDKTVAFGFDLTETAYNMVKWEASSYDGRATVWKVNTVDDYQQPVTVRLSASKGQAKLALVDSKGNVTTVAECGEDDKKVVVETVLSMSAGDNLFKLVGYGCKDVEVQITLKNGEINTSNE